MFGIIYKITNNINGKIYIGQTTKSINERLKKHYYSKRIYKNYCLPRALNKYGLENFSVEELCSCKNKEDLNNLEIYFIEYYNSLVPNGYNMTIGGEGSIKTSEQYAAIVKKRSWYKHSDETKEKIRLAHLGKKKQTPESLKKMVETRRLRGNLGRKRKNKEVTV